MTFITQPQVKCDQCGVYTDAVVSDAGGDGAALQLPSGWLRVEEAHLCTWQCVAVYAQRALSTSTPTPGAPASTPTPAPVLTAAEQIAADIRRLTGTGNAPPTGGLTAPLTLLTQNDTHAIVGDSRGLVALQSLGWVHAHQQAGDAFAAPSTWAFDTVLIGSEPVDFQPVGAGDLRARVAFVSAGDGASSWFVRQEAPVPALDGVPV